MTGGDSVPLQRCSGAVEPRLGGCWSRWAGGAVKGPFHRGKASLRLPSDPDRSRSRLRPSCAYEFWIPKRLKIQLVGFVVQMEKRRSCVTKLIATINIRDPNVRKQGSARQPLSPWSVPWASAGPGARGCGSSAFGTAPEPRRPSARAPLWSAAPVPRPRGPLCRLLCLERKW